MRDVQRVLDLEDLPDMFLAIRVGAEVPSRAAPKVILVVVPEIANATHLEGMSSGVEPNGHPTASQLWHPVPHARLLSRAAVAGPGCGEGRHDRSGCQAVRYRLGDPARVMRTRTVLDQNRHVTAPKASTSRCPLRNR